MTECATACDKESGCKSFTYCSEDEDGCYLKGLVMTSETKKDHPSAFKSSAHRKRIILSDRIVIFKYNMFKIEPFCLN